MRRALASVLLVCMLMPTPAQAFSQAQINSLLGLLTAFNVPHTAIATVSSVLSGTPIGFDPFAPGVVRSAITYISHHADPEPEEEPGSSTPDWVPTNAKIYIDLVNNRAWTEEGGEVAIDTLLGSDPNTENGWDTSEYDNSNSIDGQGYYTSQPLAFIGGARSMLLAGATSVVRLRQFDSIGGTDINFVMLSADGNDGIEVDLDGSRSATGYDWSGTLIDPPINVPNIRNEVLGEIPTGAVVNVLAFTIVSDRIDVAANGSDAETVVPTGALLPGLNPLVAAILYANGLAIQSITIYDALPTTAGLSELSETGVTNTAPTVIGTPPVPNSYPDNTTDTVNIFGSNDVIAVSMAGLFADADGNPLTLTVGSFDPDLPVYRQFINGGPATGNDGQDVFAADFGVGGVSAGDYVFTVRATDPGGLYTEQEFTITITPPLLDYTYGAEYEETTLDLSAVTAANEVSILSCPNLESIDFSALESVAGSYTTGNIAPLTSLNLSSLETVVGSLNISGTALTGLSLPALISTGIFTLSTHSSLMSLDVPNLVSVRGISISNLALETLSFPSLTTVGNYTFGIQISANDTMTSISLPAIETIGTSAPQTDSIHVTEGGALTSFTLGPNLRFVRGNVILDDAALNQASVDNILVRLAALDGTGSTTSYDNKTVTITGTAAHPSATGLAAKATLEARGNTVTVNP